MAPIDLDVPDRRLSAAFWPAFEGRPAAPETIGAMLRRQAAARAGQAALKELDFEGGLGREWTYAALLHDCERLARALASRHAPGARIAIWANNTPEWVLVEIASAMAGLTLVTVNPAFQARELKYVLEQSRAEGLYLVETFRGNPMRQIADAVVRELPALRHVVLLTDHDSLYGGERSGALPDCRPDDVCQIQYTSGTTGFPKGALLHHWGLLKNGFDAMTRAGVRPGDAFIHHMPLFHTTGCAILVLGGLGVGATMLLAPAFDPDMIIRATARERTRFMLGVPTMLVALIDSAMKSGLDVSSVEKMMSGGSMVAPELVRKAREVFGSTVQIVYGQTEASPVITQTCATDAFDDLCGTIGRPLPDVDVSIRDVRTNEVCAIGEQGEICARGYLIMTGYNDNPDATAKAIDGEGWLHTGDLGRMDERGFVKITGRVKEMIIRGGENLFPAEIENALLEHPEIAEVAVVGVADERWGEQVACFMRARAGRRPAAQELKSFIRERLAPQKTPAYWVWVYAWPLTGSGKIQKFKLAESFQNGELRAEKS